MKKKNVINLIKYHVEKNDSGFRNEAYDIAQDFNHTGDYELAEYIMALMSDANTFVPQMEEGDSVYFERITTSSTPLWLPDEVFKDLRGISNAISHNIGINKFLFEGKPGTGKTEAVKHLSNILEREIYMVDFPAIIDSKLGQTQKNISSLFEEINNFSHPERVLILFDEIDAIALDRSDNNDLREMGRAASTLLKGFDRLNENVVLVATTNLFKKFDKAIIRRFDSVINFNRYTQDDLIDIAEQFLNDYILKFKIATKDIRLFRKIMSLKQPIPYPGELKNIIRTSIAFSNPDDGKDYLRRLYTTICGTIPNNLNTLKAQGFTLREIEILTNIPKSSVSRKLKEI